MLIEPQIEEEEKEEIQVLQFSGDSVRPKNNNIPNLKEEEEEPIKKSTTYLTEQEKEAINAFCSFVNP